MANSPTPPEPANRNDGNRLLQFLRRPSTLIIGGTILGLGVIGYTGIRIFLYQKLSPLVEAQLSQMLDRDVEVGGVEEVSWLLNRIRLGSSAIPVTASDRDSLFIDAIEVTVNPLPLLLGKGLGVDVVVVDPNLYLDQDKTGKWIDFELKGEGELPPLDVSIQLQDVDIALLPYGSAEPITITVDGDSRYRKGDLQEINYDIQATVFNSEIKAKGETVIETGKTEVALTVEKLGLNHLVSLIPKTGVMLNSGDFEANLDFNLPSFDKIDQTRGEGNLTLTEVEAEIQPLKEPLKVDLAIALAGQKVIVEQAEASLGKGVAAEITGEIDWQEGYNLAIAAKPVGLDKLAQSLSIPLPLPVSGEMEANLQLNGLITEPVVTGTINNTKTVRLDKTEIKAFNTRFQADLDKVVVQNLQIEPVAGGEITGKGWLETGMTKAIEEKKPIDWQKMPLALNFKADLPSQKLMAPYYRLSNQVSIGTLTAQGQVGGTLAKPLANLKWQAAKTAKTAEVNLTGKGEVVLNSQNLLLRNTELRTDEGKISVRGNGDLAKKQWQAYVNANSFAVTPFLAPLCQNNSSPVCTYVNEEPITLENAKVQLGGRLDNFALANLTGIANLNLKAEDSLVALQSRLGKGQIQANVKGRQIDLNPFLPNLSTPIRVARTDVNLSGSLDKLWKNSTLDLKALKVQAQTLLTVADGTINASTRLNGGNLNTLARASSIALNPFLPNLSAPVRLTSSNINLSASLDRVLQNPNQALSQIQAQAETLLTVADGTINANTRLSGGNLNTLARASSITLNPFLPDLSAPVRLTSSNINLSASLDRVLQNPNQALNQIQAQAETRLRVADGAVSANTQLNRGIIKTVGAIEQLSLAALVPNLPVPTKITESDISLTGNLSALVASLNKTPDLSSFTANAKAKLAVAQGTINAIAQLKNNQWQSNITASELKTAQILEQLGAKSQEIAQIPNANGNIDLSGSIASLFQPNANLPINADRIHLRLEEETLDLKADGTLLLANVLKSPDIANLNLDVTTQSKLDRLPLTELVAQIPVKRDFLPQEIKATGNADFQGRLKGKNLLSAPTAPGNLLLSGNLKLIDFILNDRAFDPILSGPVKVAPGEEIALNLTGEDDIIAANLEPCTRADCPAPYLVSSFKLHQIGEDQPPLIAEGKQVGDRLVAQVQNFPLAWLKIEPGTEYGILGLLQGQVTANFDLDLFALSGSGSIKIEQPGIGKIEAREFNANLAYKNNVASLQAAVLQLGESNYQVDGNLNVKTGAIQGKLDVEKGYIQDLLNTFRISDISSLVALLQFQKLNYPPADEVQPNGVGNANATVAEQVNLLGVIDRQIRALTAQRETTVVPTELDFKGAFDTQVKVAGTLSNPQVNFQFQGKHWEWKPQAQFASLIEPLGLVVEASRSIPLNAIALQGSLENGQIELKSAQIESRDTFIAANGGLDMTTLEFKPSQIFVKNLSLDTVSDFVKLPADLAGNVTSNISITGDVLNPKVEGQFTFVDGAVNGKVLGETVQGTLNYTDARLEVRTLAPDSMQIYASAPYPIIPGTSDRVQLDAKLTTNALALVDVLTQGQIAWLDGNGEVTLKADGRIELNNELRVYDLVAKGQVVLDNATIKSAAFTQPLVVNGQISLNEKELKVEELFGSFAQSKVAVTGILPLLQPLNPNDRDRANPLTIVIEKGEVDLENLYRGGIDGKVVVTGTALTPSIEGEVLLSDGQIIVPENQQQNPKQTVAPGQNTWVKNTKQSQKVAAIVPKLNNFRVKLQGLSIEQEPLYDFDFGGALTLNGSLINLNTIQPQGVIALQRGRVSFLDTRFLLDRRRYNTIVFNKNEGLLNPDLDIQLRTIVSDLSESQRQRFEQVNEIPDESLDRAERIDVTLNIDGQLSQLLPSLNKDAAQICQIHSQTLELIPQQAKLSQEELDRLSTCLQTLAYNYDASDVSLLSNPIIELTSSPPRSQGEIVQILSDRLFALTEVLQSQNTEQILQFGLVQIALPMVFQGIVYDVENTLGNAIGSSDLRLFPVLETTYRVDEESFFSVSYDYSFNEFKVRYERRF